MAGKARGNILIGIEECKGCGLCVESCPPKCLELPAGTERLRRSSGALHGRRLHRLRHLLLLLSRAGRDHRLPAGAAAESPRPRRSACGNSVRATSPSSKAPSSPAAAPTTATPSRPPARSPKPPRCYLPQVGGTFLQAESEVAAINMVYGAASAGVRVMTASSGPGLSLMQEGISYMAGAELPCVIVDVDARRPRPGQHRARAERLLCQVVKGGGHGSYRNLVLAPASVQEMADLTMLAFDLADKYRNPAVVLTDGFIGQMMEPLDLEIRKRRSAPRRLGGSRARAETRKNLITSIYLEPDELEEHVRKLEAKYQPGRATEPRYEELHDRGRRGPAGGLRHRLARAALGGRPARAAGLEGRTVPAHHPLPVPRRRRWLKRPRSVGRLLVVELSTGQMVEDVRLALERQGAGRVLRPGRRQRALGRGSAFATDAAHDGAGVGCGAGLRSGR